MNTSHDATRLSTAAAMSAALCTSTRSTLAGVGSVVGPATSVTVAPASAAACASAKPILPELVLVMPRTGSIASNVGPAVSSTRLPASTLGCAHATTASKISCGSEHPPGAGFAAGLIADARAEHDHAVGDEPRDVPLRGRVAPHLPVHRRRDEERAIARERQRRQQIVGMAVRDLGQKIRGRRRNDDRVGAARKIDVPHAVVGARGPEIGQHGIARQRLQRDRRDEAAGPRRHHDVHGDVRLDEQARELGRLVRGDAARQSEDDPGQRFRLVWSSSLWPIRCVSREVYTRLAHVRCSVSGAA